MQNQNTKLYQAAAGIRYEQGVTNTAPALVCAASCGCGADSVRDFAL